MARSYDASTSVSAEQLRAILSYEPETGDFRWRADTKAKGGIRPAGSVAGLSSKGRRYIGIKGRRYAAHRLAWLYMTGNWPSELDHRDQNAINNRWSNLREATRSQNNANMRLKSHNNSGFKGVHWDGSKQKWTAQICVNKKRLYLGRYPTAHAASQVYRVAAIRYFGEFSSL